MFEQEDQSQKAAVESNQTVTQAPLQLDGDVTNKPRSNSDVRGDSIPSRVKKSGSFLAKLQTTHDDINTGPSIPSSIVSAFSSFSSSLASNFTLNSPTDNSLTIETASTSTKLSQIGENREDVFIKKAAMERKNLISLTKLIVKDLISSSLLVSRTVDENAIHLNNYFTLIDRVLKHGLKQNLLSNKSANLWNALDSLPKYLKESTLMSESVRSLANTKTPDGKIKAWVRLAMMQKKLPEYINELLANKNLLLKDIYHDYAFMLNDEAHVFAGLIIGVNVIDCNFFVKDANFDIMDDIIDLSPYLRVANSFDEDEDEHAIKQSEVSDEEEKWKSILDQKNYLEEWNKRLESTIMNLQSKIRNLEDENSKLEMEAKVSEARISKLQQGRRSETPTDRHSASGSLSGSTLSGALKSLISTSDSLIKQPISEVVEKENTVQAQTSNETAKDMISEDGRVSDDHRDPEIQEHKSELSEEQVSVNIRIGMEKLLEEKEKELIGLKERTSILEASYRCALDRIKVLERDLDVQTSMNADKETTIKMYEKDIREKQTQVESLRNSLNDSNKLQSDLSARLNETSAKLKERVKMVSTLQENLDKWKIENKTLASRFQDKQNALKTVNSELEKAKNTIEDLKKYNERINDDLRKERESGQSSSVTVETQNAQISELTNKISQLEAELSNVKPYKDQSSELEKRCREYELSLEEIGTQLRESRLEVENLKENSAVFLDSQWMDSKQVKSCALCQQLFSVTRRKHHCRLCGNVFCQTCSDNKMELASSSKPVRVCDTCHSFLLAKFVKQ